jgi:hypothetical protein
MGALREHTMRVWSALDQYCHRLTISKNEKKITKVVIWPIIAEEKKTKAAY